MERDARVEALVPFGSFGSEHLGLESEREHPARHLGDVGLCSAPLRRVEFSKNVSHSFHRRAADYEVRFATRVPRRVEGPAACDPGE